MTLPKITVATTVAAFAMEYEETWNSWLRNAESIVEHGREAGFDVEYFAAIEVDGRGLAPFDPMLTRLAGLGTYWAWELRDGRTDVHTNNRLRHITAGQNFASEYANANGSHWMLFLAADTAAPDDVIPKLLELRHPLCGFELPTYCLTGTPVDGYPFPVEEQLISAAGIFIHRKVFTRLRWRYDNERGMSDDPAYRYDAATLLGIPSYVRKDCVGRHFPETIGPIESRYPGRDMRIH